MVMKTMWKQIDKVRAWRKRVVEKAGKQSKFQPVSFLIKMVCAFSNIQTENITKFTVDYEAHNEEEIEM